MDGVDEWSGWVEWMGGMAGVFDTRACVNRAIEARTSKNDCV